LKQKLVAHLGFQAVALGIVDEDLFALVTGGDRLDDDDDLEEVDSTGLFVELRLHLALHPERALGGGQDGLLEGLDQHGPVDFLLF
jgi:hypothetical protein